MNFLLAVLNEARTAGTLWVLSAFAITAMVVSRKVPEDRRRLRTAALFLIVHLVLLPIASHFAHDAPDTHNVLHTLAVLAGALAAIGLVMTFVFKVILVKMGLNAPRIVRDVIGAALLVVVLFSVASQLGFNITSLIATSAVVTAVIGLALQDTLGNVIGGLMLQSDRTVEVGDWIKLGDTVGRVVDVRWRYTAVETRNWETLIVPNGQLVKNQVLVLARRQDQPAYWRRNIEFRVDFRFSPTRVIEAAEAAVCSARIPRIAEDPRPNCILKAFNESTAQYVLRYHLTDLHADDPTDSEVRIRIYHGLQRADIPMALPAQTVFVTENAGRKASEVREDEAERRDVVDRIGLFKGLPADERHIIADGLRRAPFARGEIMTRQGAEGHWLYLIVSGQVVVTTSVDGGHEAEVSRLTDGDFFGELSLMTGEPRNATVTALTDVVCFRLDRTVFKEVIKRRPELAVDVSKILAERRMQLLSVKEGLDKEAQARGMEQTQLDFVDRIRAFFDLGA